MQLKSRYHLAKLFAKEGFKIGAEVGVAGGRFSKALFDVIPDLDLFLIDTWQRYKGNPRGGKQEQHDRNWELAHERLKGKKAHFMKGFSMDRVKEFNDEILDFVYIDAHHSFDYVMQDIIEWGKKVRKGGIISGHDYYSFRWAGVVEAVDAYVKAHNLELHLTSKETDNGEVSWFFYKPEKEYDGFIGNNTGKK